MTLTIEKHPDISLLSSCFKKIENLADDLGLEVDELISDKFRKVRSAENQISHFRKEGNETDWKVIW